MVIRYQQRAILQHLHIHRPAAVFVVLKKSGEKRLLRLHAAILVQLYDNDVGADLLGPVPGAVAGDEDRILILAGKHFTRVKRSEERRVGKECRARWRRWHEE